MPEVTAAQASDGLIDPDLIPGYRLDAGAIGLAVSRLRRVASLTRSGVSGVDGQWRRLPGVFEVPSGDVLYGAVNAPAQALIGAASNFDRMAGYLDRFAEDVAELKDALDDVRKEARTFVNSLVDGWGVWMPATDAVGYEGDVNAKEHTVHSTSSYSADTGLTTTEASWYSVYDVMSYLRGRGERVLLVDGVAHILVSWKQSSDKVARNNELLREVAAVYAQLSAAEAECANKINALREDAAVASVQAVTYEDLTVEGAVLPWGAAAVEDRNCGEQVLDGVIEFGVGVLSLSNFFAIKLDTWPPEFFAWGAAGNAWLGLGSLVGSVAILGLGPGGYLFGTGVHDWAESNVEELGKSLVAWDTWEESPWEAGTVAALNIATIFMPAGAITKTGKVAEAGVETSRLAGAAAKVESWTARGVSWLSDATRVDELAAGWGRLALDDGGWVRIGDQIDDAAASVDNLATAADDMADAAKVGGQADSLVEDAARLDGLADDVSRLDGVADDAGRGGAKAEGAADDVASSADDASSAESRVADDAADQADDAVAHADGVAPRADNADSVQLKDAHEDDVVPASGEDGNAGAAITESGGRVERSGHDGLLVGEVAVGDAEQFLKDHGYWSEPGSRPEYIAPGDWGATMMSESIFDQFYAGNALATLGPESGTTWLAPAIDTLLVESPADALVATGRAPTIVEAVARGEDVVALLVPLDKLDPTVPTLGQAGANEHFLLGGHTAIRSADGSTVAISAIREMVVPGGGSVPPGSVAMRLSEAGWSYVGVFGRGT